MAKRKHAVSSRDRGHRPLRWLLLVAAGLAGGLLLGEMAAENLRGGTTGSGTPYSSLSANPDALAPVALPQDACLDCPDSYGVAARLRAARETRMGDAFRELGAIDADAPPTNEPTDDYRYGGRFPDASSPDRATAAPVEQPADGAVYPPIGEEPQP